MRIAASIKNSILQNEITVQTESSEKKIAIPGKPDGNGSSVNGGELLFLSLATCFCNDIYREAAKRKMKIASVDVHVTGEFDNEGEPGFNISYQTKIEAPDSTDEEIENLILYVDSVAEIHNTLRKGVDVVLRK